MNVRACELNTENIEVNGNLTYNRSPYAGGGEVEDRPLPDAMMSKAPRDDRRKNLAACQENGHPRTAQGSCCRTQGASGGLAAVLAVRRRGLQEVEGVEGAGVEDDVHSTQLR